VDLEGLFVAEIGCLPFFPHRIGKTIVSKTNPDAASKHFLDPR
jgi:hypothetical protein